VDAHAEWEEFRRTDVRHTFRVSFKGETTVYAAKIALFGAVGLFVAHVIVWPAVSAVGIAAIDAAAARYGQHDTPAPVNQGGTLIIGEPAHALEVPEMPTVVDGLDQLPGEVIEISSE
jgi:hypothetical protein